MQKILRNIPIIYFVLLLIETIVSAVMPSYGYELIITNRTVWFLIGLLIQLAFAAISILKKNELTKAAVIISQTLPLLALVRYYYIDSFISMVPYDLIAIYAFISFLCCFVISLLKITPHIFRITCAIINSILLFIFLALLFGAVTFGSISEQTIATEKISPNGSFMASIERADSGALGGATNVFVEDLTSSINLGYGRFSRVCQLYSGEWNNHVRIEWKDDQTLLNNGKVFPLSEETFLPKS